jgi:hypothetical protein
MIPLIAALGLGHAAPATATCAPFTVEIPELELAEKLPKGFAWEGVAPIAALSDGRYLLARSAALGGLSAKALREQHDLKTPLRVTQLVVVAADGTVERSVHVPRGTLVEAHALPGGGLLLAYRAREATRLVHLPPQGAAAVEIDLPEKIRDELSWRDVNPIRGTGPARLTPTSATTAVYAWGGEAFALELGGAGEVRSTPVWSNQLAFVRAEGAPPQIFGIELGDRLLHLGADLTTIDQRPCGGCRVAPLVGADGGIGAYAALARPRDGAINVVMLGSGATLGALPAGLDVPLPDALGDASWAWALRPGPDGSALLTVSTVGDERFYATSRILPPDGDGPPRLAWTRTEVGVGAPGQRVVADAVSGLVRLRIVTGEGGDMETHGAALATADNRARSDWSTDVDPVVRPLLVDTFAAARQGPHTGLHADVDPMLARVPPGPSTTTLRRCALDAPKP